MQATACHFTGDICCRPSIIWIGLTHWIVQPKLLLLQPGWAHTARLSQDLRRAVNHRAHSTRPSWAPTTMQGCGRSPQPNDPAGPLRKCNPGDCTTRSLWTNVECTKEFQPVVCPILRDSRVNSQVWIINTDEE